MADRSIKVTLRANVADFKAQMAQASRSLEDVAKSGDKTGQVATTALGRMTQSAQLQRAQWDMVSTGLLGVSAASSLAVGAVIKTYADFDQAMSSVAAATHESAANMELLREAAIQAGADTAYSATEAASAIEALAKAGVSTTDILNGGLQGALDLAAAGSLDVGQAAEIAATAMTQFKLSGDQTTHVADLLAAGAGKAQGDVTDLGMALKQSGLVAAQTGLSIEETTGTLAAFASAGLIGSDAGTSFKTMLQRLTPQSKEAQKAMDDLGISAYDAQGNFIGLEAFAGQLKTSMSGLTTEQRQAAMATIFGSDAVRAASVLYEQGAEGVREWTNKVNDSGYAAETAAKRLDNLKGDWEKLTGSLETLFLKSGSSANDFLRTVVQTAEKAIDTFGNLPGPVQQGALALTAFVAVGSGVVGMGMKLFTTFTDMHAAVKSLDGALPIITRLSSGFSQMRSGAGEAVRGIRSFSDEFVIARANGVGAFNAIGEAAVPALGGIKSMAKGAGTALLGAVGGPAGLAVTAGLAAITYALSAYAEKQAEANALADEYARNLDAMTGALNQSARELAATKLQEAGALEAYKRLGGASKDLVDALAGVPEAQERVNAVLADVDDQYSRYRFHQTEFLKATGKTVNDMRVLATGAHVVREAMGEQSEAIETAKARQEELAEAGVAVNDSQTDMAAAVESATSEVDDQTEALNDLIKAMSKAAGNALSLRDAQRNYEEALVNANKTLAENGQTLDITTEAGRKNQAALDGIASAAWDTIDSLTATGASTDELQASMQRSRGDFIAMAESMGMDSAAAEALADQLRLIPEDVTTQVAVDGAAESDAQLNELIAKVKELAGEPGIITISADDSEATKKLMDSLGLVAFSEGTYTINANDEPALAALLYSIGEVDSSTGTITINGDKAPVLAAADQAASLVNTRTGTITINGVDYATGEARAAQARINSLSAYIQVYAQTHGSSAGLVADTFADGGIYTPKNVKRFAGGGVENHVAQIAPAGAWRVWAEPETGGEGYVPLAPSKRQRSRRVMAEIARRFGDTYIPSRSYAAGGVNAAPVVMPPVGQAPVVNLPDRLMLVDEEGEFTAHVRLVARGEVIKTMKEIR